MEINPTTTTTAKSASGTTATSDKDAATSTAAQAVTGDFQTFLTLLTTQMQNQDPLKPMESTEFVSQLASFSGVEQQIRSNDRLDDILGVLSGGTPAGLAEWIGKEVRAPAKVGFAGDPVEVGVTPVAGADRAVLVVTNDFGQVVARQAVEPGATSLTWDGGTDLGQTAAEGRYGLALESYQGDALLGTQDATVFTPVKEVRMIDGAPVLVVADGTQVALDDVSAVR